MASQAAGSTAPGRLTDVQATIDKRLANAAQTTTSDEVEDENDEELESLQNELTAEARLAQQLAKLNIETLTSNLQSASEAVVVGRTLVDYTRYWKHFVKFCLLMGFITDESQLDTLPLPADLPRWIAAWIMEQCDTLDIRTNKPKSREQLDEASGYGHGMKMRAAISHHYARQLQLGQVAWHEITPGVFAGNPSVSPIVSQYMASLKRRKAGVYHVQAGEVTVSARAISLEDIGKMYEHNQTVRDGEFRSLSRRERDDNPDAWGGPRLRAMMHALYLLSFYCLLRYDEAIKIQVHDIELRGDMIILRLPFRKTSQFGDILPFPLHRLPDDQAHLCPVRALAKWIYLSGIGSGFLFRRFAAGDRVSASNEHITSAHFLELFRHNLIDVGLDPRPYGTHSFRRGGCQYLHLRKRWPMSEICLWGGWSADFDSGTIFKYLLSFVDTPSRKREDFFNPRPPPADYCPVCGRSCNCAS